MSGPAARYLVPLAEAVAVERFGGKAAQLAALAAHADDDARVPAGYAVGAELFRDWIDAVLAPSQRPERLVAGSALERRGDRVEQIRARLLEAPLPEGAARELCEAARTLGGPLAVRSSALHEDSDEGSAAGLQETVLGVEGDAALLDAVKRCLASLFRERALAYLARAQRERRGVGVARAPAVALVLQRMVPATVAGVVFTRDPVAPGDDVLLVEAAPGLGLAVVDGTLAPDLFRVARSDCAVLARVLGDKPFAYKLGAAGVERVECEAEAARRACLDDAQVARVAAAALRVERAFGAAPRDVEWALAGDALYLLQARPIAGLRAPQGRPAASASRGEREREGFGAVPRGAWVWSNVNVGEALPGVATPLTWSVGAAFSEQGFRRAFAALACEVPREAELVGQFYGRIYLNLTHFVRIASQVPLLDPRWLLEFGGGGGLELVERQLAASSWRPFLLRAPGAALQLARENALLERDLRASDEAFTAWRARLDATDFSALTHLQLAALLDELEVLLDRTGLLMLTCASNSLATIIALRLALRALAPAAAPRLERELLAGNAELESAAPGVALVHLGEQLRRDEPAARAVREAELAALTGPEALPEGPARRALESFLRAYGFRAAREAELSTPRWSEDPRALFATLRGQLEGGAAAASAALARVERQFAAREAAERELFALLSPVTRAGARHLLARTRRFVRLRERMRARVTEVLGFYRRVALEASRRLRRSLDSVGDDAAFYLRVDELRGWLRGAPVDAPALVLARRAEHLRDLARPDPPGVFVGAPPPSAPVAVPAGDRLRGVAASPGCVTGVVRVLRAPEDAGSLRPGEVLVAPVADVGWTPLFLLAAAVVTELGGALSHAAVVAREYGVPAVVNVAGVTRALRSGDRVRVDGDRGFVEVLAREGQGMSPS